MTAHALCPCCGYDLAADQPILINDFAMNGAGFPLMYHDQVVPITPNEALLCWALMKSYPSHVTTMGLVERLDSGSDDPDGIIRIHVCRIRRALRALGAPQPIRTLSRAYVWDPQA